MRRPVLFRSSIFFFFQAEDGIRDYDVTGVQTCALPICYYASRTRYATLGFEITISGRMLMFLTSSNMMLIWFSFGLAYPYVLLRNARYLCDYLTLVGDQDFAAIAQNLKPRPTTGEGMAEAFDIGDF